MFKEDIISPESLHDATKDENVMMRLDNGTVRMGLVRDLAKRWVVVEGADGEAYLALLSLENQTFIDYTMPYRSLAMDALNCGGQISDIEKDRGKEFRKKAEEIIGRPMTDDEFMSHFLETDRIRPIVTLVVYYGDKPWDGPRCLKVPFRPAKERWSETLPSVGYAPAGLGKVRLESADADSSLYVYG